MSGRSLCGERGLKFVTLLLKVMPEDSRSLCGERGLKSTLPDVLGISGWCRSLCGERGLKYTHLFGYRSQLPSLPLRGAWIEIMDKRSANNALQSRSLCGERGLKCLDCHRQMPLHRVAPFAGSVD